MSTTTNAARFAVLNPIGGSHRAQVCSVHATHLGAVRHLSPGRIVGIVPAGTEPLANVALTTAEEHLAAEARRVAGERCVVQVLADARTTAEAVVEPASANNNSLAGASVDAMLVTLEALPDGAGFGAIVQALPAR